jgi:hypothetical protein
MYDYGCYSSNDKTVTSRFRFFAPINIDFADLNSKPDAFVIYRLDKTKTDFNEALKAAKLVKSFDLTDVMSSIASSFEDSSIRLKLSEGFETTGIDIATGQYARKSETNINSLLANERTITEYENYFTNCFQRNNLVYSNILNLEFCFDDDISTSMDEYIGFYVSFNELSKTDIDAITDTTTFKLLRTETSIIPYDSSMTPKSYEKQSRSMTILSYGYERAPQIRIQVKFNPKVNETFALIYGGSDIIRFKIEPSMIANNKSATIDNLISVINSKLQLSTTISMYAFKYDDTSFIIRSSIKSTAYEAIQTVLPVTFVNADLLYSTTNNQFYGADKYTIATATYVPITESNKIILMVNDVKRTYVINRIVRYGDLYLYSVNAAPTTISSTICHCMRTYYEQPIICSVIDHKTIDYDTLTSMYSNLLDFDPVLYSNYVQSIVNADDFVGVLENPTPTELADYKSAVLSQANKYFNNIQIDSNFLIKDIDISTLEATTIDNEYERLNESNLPTFTKTNRLLSFINKWNLIVANKIGFDCYNNEYRLNISLPFKYDNFSPSTETYDRDLRHNTHALPIIIEGKPPYYDISESTIKKILSYSTEPIELAEFSSTTIDAYSKLTYQTNVKNYHAWSTFEYDGSYDTVRCFFRGLLFDCPDVSLDGYRFAVVLKTRYPTNNDTVVYSFIRNDAFKTITLAINFYVPDPILTRQERSIDNYMLDRSLLYFSSEIYSTSISASDFGFVDVSLQLYASAKDKRYIGKLVTDDTWFITDSSGVKRIYVARGNSGRFGTAFQDILDINSDFTIIYGDQTDTTDPYYGMQITFMNIQDITTDYFWCDNVRIEYVTTIDPNTPKDPHDNTVSAINVIYLLDVIMTDPNLVKTVNILYAIESMVYESFKYRKIVKARANAARYKGISAASISKYLAETSIPVIDTDTFLTMRIIDPAKSSVVVSLKSDIDDNGNSILSKTDKYSFDIRRYDGIYKPKLIDISTFNDYNDLKRISFNRILTENRFRQNIAIDSTSAFSTSYVEPNINRTTDAEAYNYVLSNQSIDVPYNLVQSEIRGFTSVMLNSDLTVQIHTTITSKSIDIVSALYEYARSITNIDAITITADQQLSMLKLYADVTTKTVSNFDTKYYILKNFILNTLLQIYTISEITVNGTKVQFTYTKSVITIVDSVNTDNASCYITLTR